MHQKLGGKEFFKAFEDFAKENEESYNKFNGGYEIALGWTKLILTQKGKTKYYFSLVQPIESTRLSCDYFNNSTTLVMDGGSWRIENIKLEKGLLTFDASSDDLEQITIDKENYPDIWGEIAKIGKVKGNIDRYAAEFNYSKFMFVKLYRYTNNKVILDYFKDNPFVIIQAPQGKSVLK